MNEKEIAKQMRALGITREEAIELLMEDAEVDRMTMKELNATLTPEQKQAQKAMTKTGTKKQTSYKFDTKKREKDAEKVEIMEEIFKNLPKFLENCEISNAGQEIIFKKGENSYSLKLTKHRKPKE